MTKPKTLDQLRAEKERAETQLAQEQHKLERLENRKKYLETETYWTIGKYIVEFEQDGNVKAEYGSRLLTKLSHQLTLRLGKGYSRPNLNNMRKFYLCYPKCQTVSDKLTWSHICELIKIDDELERSFYEKECYKEKWDVRTLRRQMDSALFLRLAASRDKEGVLALICSFDITDEPSVYILSINTASSGLSVECSGIGS